MRRAIFATVLGATLVILGIPAAKAGPPLIVDDNGAECANADHPTISAAVAAAAPGSTILVCAGTYQEAVTISTADLTLRAIGAPGTVVVDANDALAAFHLLNVSGVTVTRFTVREGHEADILLTNADDNRILRNAATAAGHDGIQLRQGSSGSLVAHNRVFDNLAGNACGILLQNPGTSGNVIRHNWASNNNWGIQLRFDATGNVVAHNSSIGNRAFGILNDSGANGTWIRGNRAFENPTGIRVEESTNVTVARNKAFDNSTVDLSWDNTGAVMFVNNHCNTSSPDGLCEHTEGEGH